MKRVWCLAAAIAALASLAWAGEPAKVTLKVEGMTCGGCVAAVKLQLKKTDGVSAYDVSLEKGEAEVTYDPSKTDPKHIAASVSKTGFTASVKKDGDDRGAGGAATDPAGFVGSKHGASCDRDCSKPGRHAPAAAGDAASPGLASLSPGATPLRSAFNAAKHRPRFLAILSPTCSACVHGAEAIKAAVLPTVDAVEVFVVWAPMLEGDDGAAAASSSRIVAGPLVRQYWDPDATWAPPSARTSFPTPSSA